MLNIMKMILLVLFVLLSIGCRQSLDLISSNVSNMPISVVETSSSVSGSVVEKFDLQKYIPAIVLEFTGFTDHDSIDSNEWFINMKEDGIYKLNFENDKYELWLQYQVSGDNKYAYSIEGDWMYYYDGNTTYKIKTDGSEKQKFIDERIYNIKSYNGYAYFINADKDRLCRIAQGTQKTEILERTSGVYNYFFYKDHLFAAVGGYETVIPDLDTGLYQFDLDGANYVRVDDGFTPINMDEPYIVQVQNELFSYEIDSQRLVVFNLETKKKTIIDNYSPNNASWVDFFIFKEKIYYENNGFRCADLDGKNKSLIVDITGEDIVFIGRGIHNGKLYCILENSVNNSRTEKSIDLETGEVRDVQR